jgi:hypothetical protein
MEVCQIYFAENIPTGEEYLKGIIYKLKKQ